MKFFNNGIINIGDKLRFRMPYKKWSVTYTVTLIQGSSIISTYKGSSQNYNIYKLKEMFIDNELQYIPKKVDEETVEDYEIF